jgi:CDP-paratose synthetase
MSKQVLLTGITGYLGSRLAEALVDKGYRVVALKRRTSALQRIEPLLASVTLHDLEELDFAKFFETHEKFDAIIHTATCYGRNGESVEQIFEANTAFPLRLLEAAIAASVATFLNTDTSLDKDVNPYSLSKKQFMEWGRYFASQKKVRFINARLEHFFGPYDDCSKFPMHVITSCLANVPELPLTAGEQKRDFIYIDDVVEAYLAILEASGSGVDHFVEYGVGSGEAVSIRQFVELVHRLTSSSTRLHFGAYPYRENESMFLQADTEALKKLGWSCKHTLEQGLKLSMEGCKQ